MSVARGTIYYTKPVSHLPSFSIEHHTAQHIVVSTRASEYFKKNWPNDIGLNDLGFEIFHFLHTFNWNEQSWEKGTNSLIKQLESFLRNAHPQTAKHCLDAVCTYLDSSYFQPEGKLTTQSWLYGEVRYTKKSDQFKELEKAIQKLRLDLNLSGDTFSDALSTLIDGIKKLATSVYNNPLQALTLGLALQTSITPIPSDSLSSLNFKPTFGNESEKALLPRDELAVSSLGSRMQEIGKTYHRPVEASEGFLSGSPRDIRKALRDQWDVADGGKSAYISELPATFGTATQSCIGALSYGAIASLALHNPLPMVPAALSCMTTCEATELQPLQNLLAATQQIISKVSDASTVISASQFADKVSQALAGSGVNPQEQPVSVKVMDALLTTADQIQTIFSPISSIVSSTRDAFAKEALSRLTTFADLKKLYDEFNNLQLAIITLEKTSTRSLDAGLNFIAYLRNKNDPSGIEEAVNQLTQINDRSIESLQKIENAITETKESISKLKAMKIASQVIIRFNANLLNTEQLSDDYATYLQNEIDTHNRNLNEIDILLSAHENNLDEGILKRAAFQKEIAECKDTITTYREYIQLGRDNLKKIDTAEKRLRSHYSAHIRDLRDQVETLQAHLRDLIKRAQARQNDPVKKDL